MPVKPVDTVPPFAVGNFPAGGDNWSGLTRRDPANLTSWAAAGYTPQEPIKNENLNEYLARIRDWVFWVEGGSFSSTLEEAHIIEADTLGQASMARLFVGGHSVAGPSLSVTGSNTLAAIFAQHSGSLNAILAQQTGTAAAIFGQATGTNNDGVQGEGVGSGRGVFGLAANNASSFGIFGETVHNDGIAVRGQIPATATANAAAVGGVGRGAGSGVLASTVGGATGYALFVFPDATTPDRAGIHIGGQDAEPVTNQSGDLYYDSGIEHLRIRTVAQFESLWATQNGFVHGGEFGQSQALSSSSSLLAQATAQIAPTVVGDVVVEVGFLGGGNATCVGITYDIFDLTATAVIAGPFDIVIISGDGTDEPDHHSVATRVEYTLPGTGTRNIQLRMRRKDAVGSFIFEQGYCEVHGFFD